MGFTHHNCLVLSREWIMKTIIGGLGYYRDPFPPSLLSTRETKASVLHRFLQLKEKLGQRTVLLQELVPAVPNSIVRDLSSMKPRLKTEPLYEITKVLCRSLSLSLSLCVCVLVRVSMSIYIYISVCARISCLIGLRL